MHVLEGVELPGQVLVITRHGTSRHLAAKLQALRESQIDYVPPAAR